MEKKADVALARAIQARMAERQMNQTQLEMETGVSRSTLAWLIKDGIGHLETFGRVCRALGIQPAQLLARADRLREELRDEAAAGTAA